MGIQINGNTNNINAGIGSLSIEDINELDIVGVVTAANFKTGTTNVHSAGIEIAGINVLGANTPIGVGATIFNSGGAIFAGTSGVVTATAFHGSGASLTGIDTDLVSDTSPQLGGDLDTNSHHILIDDDHEVKFGNDSDLRLFHSGSQNLIQSYNNKTFRIQSFGTGQTKIQVAESQNSVVCIPSGATELYHSGNKKFETTSDGIKIAGSTLEMVSTALVIDLMEDGVTDSNHRIRQNAGNLYIQKLTDNKSTSTTGILVDGSGYVGLNHNGSSRIETTSSGAKVIGNLAFNSTGQGIDFGSSVHASGMANELLDDYEEGSWTPVFATAGSGGSTVSNPSNTQATYVKVGRIVYLHLGVHGLTKNWAGSNTQVFIRGLPYRSYFQHSGHPIRHGYWGANDDDLNVYAQITQYQTYMELQKGGGAQGRYEPLYWSDMHWEGYGNLTLEITYETDQGT